MEVNSLIKVLYQFLIELTNRNWTSKLIKQFAQSKLSGLIVPSFAKVYKIDQLEIEKSIHEFPTLHELFVRRLKEGARATDPHPLAVVSPVDAVLEDIGSIKESSDIVVKGKTYSIAEMLGNSQLLPKYINGTYMVLYLSPSHYHRIHSPASGKVVNQWTLGGKSYPVNKLGLKYGKAPLSKNYRTITELQHEYGHVSVVKVGALFVNSIEVVHKGEQINKGEELAYFTFGSTIVLLFEKDSFQVLPAIQTPAHIKVGEKLGYIENAKNK